MATTDCSAKNARPVAPNSSPTSAVGRDDVQGVARDPVAPAVPGHLAAGVARALDLDRAAQATDEGARQEGVDPLAHAGRGRVERGGDVLVVAAHVLHAEPGVGRGGHQQLGQGAVELAGAVHQLVGRVDRAPSRDQTHGHHHPDPLDGGGRAPGDEGERRAEADQLHRGPQAHHLGKQASVLTLLQGVDHVVADHQVDQRQPEEHHQRGEEGEPAAEREPDEEGGSGEEAHREREAFIMCRLALQAG